MEHPRYATDQVNKLNPAVSALHVSPWISLGACEPSIKEGSNRMTAGLFTLGSHPKSPRLGRNLRRDQPWDLGRTS